MPLEQRDGFVPHHKAAPNPRIKNPYPGMAAFLLSSQSQDPAHAAARDIANVARGIAPRSGGRYDSDVPGVTAYGDSFRAERVEKPVTIAGNPRLIAAVTNDHPAAPSQEFGGKHNKNPSRTLGKAGAQIGDYRGGADAD